MSGCILLFATPLCICSLRVSVKYMTYKLLSQMEASDGSVYYADLLTKETRWEMLSGGTLFPESRDDKENSRNQSALSINTTLLSTSMSPRRRNSRDVHLVSGADASHSFQSSSSSQKRVASVAASPTTSSWDFAHTQEVCMESAAEKERRDSRRGLKGSPAVGRLLPEPVCQHRGTSGKNATDTAGALRGSLENVRLLPDPKFDQQSTAGDAKMIKEFDDFEQHQRVKGEFGRNGRQAYKQGLREGKASQKERIMDIEETRSENDSSSEEWMWIDEQVSRETEVCNEEYDSTPVRRARDSWRTDCSDKDARNGRSNESVAAHPRQEDSAFAHKEKRETNTDNLKSTKYFSDRTQARRTSAGRQITDQEDDGRRSDSSDATYFVRARKTEIESGNEDSRVWGMEGDWLQTNDPLSGRVYWANPRTGQVKFAFLCMLG